MIKIEDLNLPEEKPYAKVEYKVRPVTRYVVTKYTQSSQSTSSENLGEFPNVGRANMVAHSLAETEQFADEVYYKLFSHEYDETEYENNGLIRVSSSR